MIKRVLVVLMLISSFGCTAVKVIPVNLSGGAMKHVCIKDGKDTCFVANMMGVIRDGFERHGITTQIYTDKLPSECDYNLTYMCNQTWDMALYMTHAELRLYHNNNQVGYAEYHLNGGGGFSLMKWQSAKTKMDPVIDKMLKEYPLVTPNR